MQSTEKIEVKDRAKAKKKPRTKLQIVLDPGTSLFKILYKIDARYLDWMVMGAEYLDIPSSYQKTLPKKLENGDPELNAWFQLEDSDRCFLVGNLAKEKNIDVNIKKSKNQLLDLRIIAAIGAIAIKHELTNLFDIRLGVLIPFNELAEIQRIEDWEANLKTKLSKFTFQGEKVKARLKKCEIQPEGYGIVSNTFNKGNKDNIAHIMMGHRNTSCLFVQGQSIVRQYSGTSDLGFYQVIKRLKQEFSYINENSFLHALQKKVPSYEKVKSYLNAEEINYLSLIPLSFNRDKEAEAKKIHEVYNQAVKEYWTSLRNWLEAILPSVSQVENMAFSGGTSYLFSREQDELMDDYGISEHSRMNTRDLYFESHILQNCDRRSRTFQSQSYGTRFTDAWGYFQNLTSYEFPIRK